MRNTLEQVHSLTRKFHFRLWFDHLDLRADAPNISDWSLRDMGLVRRDFCRPGPFWVN